MIIEGQHKNSLFWATTYYFTLKKNITISQDIRTAMAEQQERREKVRGHVIDNK